MIKLLVTQRFNRVQPSRLSGREVPEQHTHRGGKCESDDNDARVEYKRDAKKMRTNTGRRDPEDDANEATEGR